jgi:hypothetical protein
MSNGGLLARLKALFGVEQVGDASRKDDRRTLGSETGQEPRFVKQLAAALVKARLADASEIRGCTEHEVATLEREAGVRLPRRFRDYLLAVGRGAGRFLQGTDAFYVDFSENNSYARELVREDGMEAHLPHDAVVIYMHQGYEFGFIVPDKGDDPPVFQYIEGRGPPKECWSSFSEYVDERLRVHEDAIRKGWS